MLDLKYVVENREPVLSMLASRGSDLAEVQSFPGLAGADPWALDSERRALIQSMSQRLDQQRQQPGAQAGARGDAGQAGQPGQQGGQAGGGGGQGDRAGGGQRAGGQQ